MARNRASAKAAGRGLERKVADHLKDKLDAPDIDRRVQYGAKDRGDIAGVQHLDQKIAIECKDYGGQIKAGTWIKEAHEAAKNDEAGAGIVVAKRRGTQDPGEQWVITTVDDFIAIVTGTPRQQL
jgi:hypothetical protein